jgi:hypothetical protein
MSLANEPSIIASEIVDEGENAEFHHSSLGHLAKR